MQQIPNLLCLIGPDPGSAAPRRVSLRCLVLLATLLLAQSLPRKRFFCTAFLAGLHIEAVLLDFLDDIFLLHLALETPQGIFQRFILLNNDFCQCTSPQFWFGLLAGSVIVLFSHCT